ncbi:MAG: hypothetical protein PHT60_15085 [Acidiphilium sp.]|nr:hypothetical protein [Acidiphilium sp.]MDD4937087.1 hypothetical protein [Acidiphilium sp.]
MTGLQTLSLAGAGFLAVLVGAGCAIAQTPGGPVKEMSPQELQKLSNENSAILHRNFGPPPPQSSIPLTQYTPVSGFWKCMGADPSKPIRSAPDKYAPKIGMTMNWVAAGPSMHGYSKLFLARGKIGYLNDRYIHPFFDKLAPGDTCTFEGVQTNGLDLFNIR